MATKFDYEQMSMPDGRTLNLYGPWRGEPRWPHLTNPLPHNTGHARWHPLRQEWVIYASARQNRTYKPPADVCPLCPMSPGGELPFEDFTVAVFENRFPAMQMRNDTAPDLSALGVSTRPARGDCEVVVYCSEHVGSIATIPKHNRELLLQVWGLRRDALMQKRGISYVMPFENRGEEAGTTLHHPHGQIYAFEDLPPVVERMATACSNGFNLHDMVPKYKAQTVLETDNALAFVPPFARYPFEMWLTTKRFNFSTSAFAEAETVEIADLLRRIVALYDRFFDRPCPYIMVVYMAPEGHEKTFPFHIQFYPLLRAKDRLKYLAGCEQGAGTFLVDVLPEVAAAQLRAAGATPA